jgi:hypothetical protein
MRTAFLMQIALLLCGLWALLITPRFGSLGHYYYYFSQGCLFALLVGWLPILVICNFIIRKKKN